MTSTYFDCTDLQLAFDYEHLEALRAEQVKISAEKKLVDRFRAALDSWANGNPAKTVRIRPCSICRSRFAAAQAARRSELPTPAARCLCERNVYAMQVYYADRFNETRELDILDAETNTVTPGAEKRVVPDWVRLVALEVELDCPARHHYTNVLADEWLGYDVTTSEDENKRAMIAREADVAEFEYAHRDTAANRWATEFDSYESQHEFIEELTRQRKAMLVRLLRAVNNDPSAPETIRFVQACVDAKSGNRLRGYSRAITILRHRIENGTLIPTGCID